MAVDPLPAPIEEHLAWSGLTRFTSDEEYFAWQRATLTTEELSQLNQHAERKRTGDRREEIAFYDLTAQWRILPVLYSQRYEYYRAIGPRVFSRLAPARTILDFGCGVGILTSWYARQCPDKQFLGVDRSSVSISVAQQQARKLGLQNVRFECADVEAQPLSGSFDLIVSTHALVQAEHDPGIPSRTWRTFERAPDPRQQAEFEVRTRSGVRIDRLCDVMSHDARIIVFEKTRQLARRVALQRLLASRGLHLLEAPEPVRYVLVEEIADDGPFYVLHKAMSGPITWNEAPEDDDGPRFDRAALHSRAADPNVPLYENHGPSAQYVWEQLQEPTVMTETTREESNGRQLHVELGRAEGYGYLYCANTFDQRQLVIVEPARMSMLQSYYEDILKGLHNSGDRG